MSSPTNQSPSPSESVAGQPNLPVPPSLPSFPKWPIAFLVLVPVLVFLVRLWIIRTRPGRSIFAQAATKNAITEKATQRRAVKGRQVWYSRYSFAGTLRHVALFVGEKKYELRRDPESHEIELAIKSYVSYLDTNDPLLVDVGPRIDDAGDSNPGTWGDFSLQLGPLRERLQFNMIGHTRMSDDQIKRFCEDIDKTWVYNLWSNNCQDFAFCVASALIRPEDRSAVWDILFGDIGQQERVLRHSGTMQDQLAQAYALMNHTHDFNTYGGVTDAHVSGWDVQGDFAISIPAAIHMHHHDGGGGGFTASYGHF